MTTNRLLVKLGFAAVVASAVMGCNNDSGAAGSTTGAAAGTTGTTPATTGVLPAGITKDSRGWEAPGELTIGLVASQNGDLKPWGDDSVKGAELAVEEFNANGGLDGKKVNLAIGDSGSKPEQGKSAAEKLMSTDKAIGLVGEVASGITAQMGQAATEKGVPVIAVGATRTDLTAGKPNIFRVCYTDAFQGPVMAKFAYEEKGCRNIAIITDKKQPYSTGLSESFKAYFTKLGGKIVDEQFYETGQTQFQGQLTNLKAKNPDGLFMSGYFNETGPLARQAVEAMPNIKGKMFGGDGWDSAEILKSGGDAILGSFFCNHYNNEETRPEVKTFLEKWDAKWGGKPATTMGALAYDAAALACDALKRAKTKDSPGLQAAIEDTTDFKGVSGGITLKGKHGNPPKRALVVMLDKDGQKFAKAYEMDEATGLPK
ncbi:ABC transporter substrate-binding protein [Fimbriimonas ginsengisoli]|uniref:Extracellular ligand-binding receptor n=1 Tax=Fimbriimonas ginsengisoli Gsoil 348 TaxID=661478 RepID=A0A068NYY8_FIMGI|nr:ABC transporter substrate-binding protein [Fimbriimonas ginsengisoli]AIE87649.1 Extracellular ligand-binding receptor [Fimbriimonas ginsengisoli Gsoil 348]